MAASAARWRRVVLDANVLVQAPIRDLLLRAAEDGLLAVHWGPTILEEVERTLVNKIFVGRPDGAMRVARLFAALARSFPKALGNDTLDGLPPLATGPERGAVDTADVHVLAVAVRVAAGVIVTHNLRHFPAAALRPHQLAAETPDRLLLRLCRHDAAAMADILARQGRDLRQPRDLDGMLDHLAQDTPRFVAAMRAFSTRR